VKPGDEENAGSAFGGLKVSWTTGIWILLLTLGVWVFFYMKQAQLDPASTGFVALAVAVIVLSVQWAFSRIRRGRSDGGGSAK
jgi:drug/metabolite transporter (DMT)-like permease